MSKELSLNELWESVPPGERVFQPAQLAALPDAARRYLERAIAPGTKLASLNDFRTCHPASDRKAEASRPRRDRPTAAVVPCQPPPGEVKIAFSPPYLLSSLFSC